MATWASVPPAMADVYRWQDASGQVHYGSRPPAGASGERLHMPSAPAAVARPTDDADRLERQRRLLDAYSYDREQRAAAAAKAEQQREQQATRCREIKRRWAGLSFAGPVFVRRADGGRDYLDDSQRAAQKERLRPAYLQACGEPPR